MKRVVVEGVTLWIAIVAFVLLYTLGDGRSDARDGCNAHTSGGGR